MNPAPKHSLSYKELATIYLKIGGQAFGGWATTVVLIENELVKKRRILTEQQLKIAAASGQSLPGPAQVVITTQTAYYTNGIFGAFIASGMYLLPSIVITILFSILYFKFFSAGDFSQYTGGLQAAVGGVILGTAYRVGKSHATSPKFWVISLFAGLACIFINIPAIFIILGFGIAGLMLAVFIKERRNG